MKHKQTLRRGLSILLSLVLCLGLLPATALAEGTATTDQTADFTAEDTTEALALLGGTEKADWDSNTSTLTLNGVNFTTTAETAVKLPAGAKIVLAEGTTNTIASAAENAYMSYGIYATNGLTIEGSGTLSVRSAKATKDLTSSNSYGIYADAGDITITSGTVVTTGGEASNCSYGIYADVASYGTVKITGGAVTATGGTADSSYSYGIRASNVIISSGTVTAEAGQATAGSWGIYGFYYVTISGGGVTATGSTAGSSSCGIYSPKVTISGGIVTATGGAVTGENTKSTGIYVYQGAVTISGGHVIARTLAEDSAGTKSALNKAPNLSGYSGYQWRTSASGDFTSSADTAYTYRESDTYVELSSQNTVTTYTVTVQNDGNGSAAASPTTAAAGTEITLSATANSGYHFKAWQVISGSVTITDNKFTMPGANVTVKAIFEEDAPSTTNTVSFDANGGSGEMTAVTGVSGSYTLPKCGFTAPSGKQFKGWATSADGEVITDTTIPVTENTTLYAVWEDIPATTCDQTADFTYGDGTAALTLLNAAKTGEAESTWDNDTKTLTLNGVDFTTSAATAVKLPNGAKIVLAEGTTNTIASTADNAYMSYGIYAGGNLTIEGSGKLTVTGGEAQAESYGIYVEDYCDAGDSNLVDGNLTISGAAEVTATGGKVTTENSKSYGIYASGNVTISDTAKVNAMGGDATADYSYSRGIYANGNVTISDTAEVTATGGTAYVNSYGISAYAGNVSISDTAEVTATGGKGTRADGESHGISAYAGNVSISGGTVTANGGEAAYSDGISAYAGNVSISGGTVTANGGEAGDYSYGIYVHGDVTIEDGTVKATGGTAGDYSYGIYVENYYGAGDGNLVDGNLTISGGHVIAQTLAGGAALNKAPDLSAYAGYQWCTSASGDFNTTEYLYDAAHTYVEFSPGATVTTYTVSFDANGGSSSMDAVTVTSGEYTLPECGFTAPSGKQFAGWATSANGAVITGTTITVTEDTTLYAVWAIPYGVTVNDDVSVTDLNKDDVLGNGLVRYDPATNTVYEKGYPDILTIAGDGSTDVVLGEGTITFLTVTGAKNVKGTNCIIVKGNIACAGDVTLEGNPCVLNVLTVTGAQNVTMTNPASGVGYTISGSVTINCSGNVIIGNASDIAVGGSLTVTGARDVTVTANTTNSLKPAIAGSADITCSGDVTISNTGGGKAVAGNLTYQNASGKHSYTVKTGDSLENLTDYATKEAGDTFTATLDAAAVKISAPHTAGEWQSNSTQHWKVCTVCGIELEREDHTFSGNTCTECGYTKSSGGGSSSSGGSSSAPTYTPSVTQPENGTVTVTPKAPKKGDTVTITPKPEAGYTVEQILVTDKNGDPVKVINNGDGTFSFTQPAGKVNVEVTFMEDNSMLNFFVDVPAGAYYYDAVLWAAENGITGGVDDTHFAPNSPCTRAQIVTFLWRAAGSPEPENVSSFADVPADSYYAKAVAWAVENGITTGTGDGKFSPDATCTRAQAMAFIWRSQKSVAADGANPFTDVAADAYYADAVQWAVENGITNGSGDGTTFSPNANCTRAQIVTFLYRCLGEE